MIKRLKRKGIISDIKSFIGISGGIIFNSFLPAGALAQGADSLGNDLKNEVQKTKVEQTGGRNVEQNVKPASKNLIYSTDKALSTAGGDGVLLKDYVAMDVDLSYGSSVDFNSMFSSEGKDKLSFRITPARKALETALNSANGRGKLSSAQKSQLEKMLKEAKNDSSSVAMLNGAIKDDGVINKTDTGLYDQEGEACFEEGVYGLQVVSSKTDSLGAQSFPALIRVENGEAKLDYTNGKPIVTGEPTKNRKSDSENKGEWVPFGSKEERRNFYLTQGEGELIDSPAQDMTNEEFYDLLQDEARADTSLVAPIVEEPVKKEKQNTQKAILEEGFEWGPSVAYSENMEFGAYGRMPISERFSLSGVGRIVFGDFKKDLDSRILERHNVLIGPGTYEKRMDEITTESRELPRYTLGIGLDADIGKGFGTYGELGIRGSSFDEKYTGKSIIETTRNGNVIDSYELGPTSLGEDSSSKTKMFGGAGLKWTKGRTSLQAGFEKVKGNKTKGKFGLNFKF